ncbi:undecaprenyldiphospho-muramoylpentapeptide beta-N-acetylglucosaminyltransferase [Gracilibacillus thailandensis]|jgi:UDP-N-acetylglucosamine--N-acetylmuramyl-(pentapeptide) pyrophosphoryl-undecaprenol N-acetylglucosamine transferase|uniref:UDP-N-acetylglucosamine--N-acetylmuramyl-(pentapeptide) pyrophosphoryl-undecaprenol N-acetylglucosamine transferase n=1 Tax=Gracilibacillus thailandensis TaxID=563735 RepID=A0A6N7R5X4_9BACI|nr:undecaprenyldiphospho-muramoylpentapeptide beta-N-acetylglucosaminyltransferase [Gracilibacillus thailandensis]MRI68673.1 undecaprenyldiphospho-muramoylpentapeptide beta-N-acetylglucosaminyltransferase [Gracilibacillus thailandensis]
MTTKQIIFTGGGTAGHVMVNLAIIPEFLKDGWTIDYIGSKNGIEKDLIEPLEGVTYHPISTGKLRRYFSKENFKDPFKVLKGTWQAHRIIGKKKPAVIFSKGGFVSVPVLVAARMRGVPAVIHESDYTPGLANKLAIPFAKKVLATFPETVQYLPEQKAEWIGAVVREELFTGSREKGFDMTGFSNKKNVLLIMGGSAGSKKINQAVREGLEELLKQFQVVHICGKDNIDETYEQEGYVQYEYVQDELKDLLAITDMVCSRAGANAIFEFLALNKPMLLIPLSRQASRGDQIVNAQSFEKQGYAKVLEEEELSTDSLVTSLLELKKDKFEIKDKMNQYRSSEAKEKVIDIIKNQANLSSLL